MPSVPFLFIIIVLVVVVIEVRNDRLHERIDYTYVLDSNTRSQFFMYIK